MATATLVKCRRFCLCRRQPTEVLRVASDSRVAHDVLMKLLRCRNAAVRAAVIGNGRMSGREIRPLLSSPSPDERIIAIYRCSGYISWRQYRRMARRDPDQAVRGAAREVLARHEAFLLAKTQKQTAALNHLQQAHRLSSVAPVASLPRFHPTTEETPTGGSADSYSGTGTTPPEEPISLKLLPGKHTIKFRLSHNGVLKGAPPSFDALLMGIDDPETVEILTSRADITEGTWTEVIRVGGASPLRPGRYELLVAASGGGDWTIKFVS